MNLLTIEFYVFTGAFSILVLLPIVMWATTYIASEDNLYGLDYDRDEVLAMKELTLEESEIGSKLKYD